MYVRQLGYKIVPGREETAAALCQGLVEALCERGVRAYLQVGGAAEATVQVIERHSSVAAMLSAHAALERDESYCNAVCSWAMAFYPLVQATLPAVVTGLQAAA